MMLWIWYSSPTYESIHPGTHLKSSFGKLLKSLLRELTLFCCDGFMWVISSWKDEKIEVRSARGCLLSKVHMMHSHHHDLQFRLSLDWPFIAILNISLTLWINFKRGTDFLTFSASPPFYNICCTACSGSREEAERIWKQQGMQNCEIVIHMMW